MKNVHLTREGVLQSVSRLLKNLPQPLAGEGQLLGH